MRNKPFRIRITQIYEYKPNNVQLGGQLIDQSVGAHLVTIYTSQDKLNIEPKIGQHWEISNDANYAIRQQPAFKSSNRYVDHWRFMHPKLQCVMPDNGSGFVSFLKQEKAFKGIGAVKAKLLWEAFGESIFSLLDNGKEAPYLGDAKITNFKAIKEVLINDETVNCLFEGYKLYSNLKYANQFVEWGIEAPVQRQLFRITDNKATDAIEFLTKNPYRLFSLGMRFNKVDKIAQEHFNIATDDNIRLTAIVEQALRSWSDRGHTIAEWQDIKNHVLKLLNGDMRLAEKASSLEGDIIGFVKKNDHYFAAGNYICERTISTRFRALAQVKRYWSHELETALQTAIPNGWILEEAQEKAVRAVHLSDIFALTGGAGTGKTTTTKIIVDTFVELGLSVHPVALSGKAARRLQQSIGIETSTIAGLLRDKNVGGENSVLVIDEASMLDSYTMWRLVTKFSPKAKIILIGDPYQLPPINAGFVLNDVISSGIINHVELDVVRRTGATSTIPEYSKLVRDNVIPPSLTTKDIHFQNVSNDMVDDAIAAHKAFKNCMVVASTNATVRTVNERLQSELNSIGKLLNLDGMPIAKGNYEFREGDPIVFTLTSYQHDIQNGTLGQIKNVSPTKEYACSVELEDLDDYGKKKILRVPWDLFEFIELAYCLTLHKLQGSQSENIILLIEDNILLDCSWIYTAITRTENEVIIIANEQIFRMGVKRKSAMCYRKTGLGKMLNNPEKSKENDKITE